MIKGINVIGYINGEFGIGEAVRSNIKAIKKKDIPVSLCNYATETPHRHEDKTFTDFSKDLPYDVSLYQISPFEVSNLVNNEYSVLLKGKYNIIYAAWESKYLPEECIKNLNLFDEIWVPSKYCLDVISKVSTVPVVNIPHPVELEFRKTDEIANLIDGKKFNFLFVFDYNSTLERKNTFNLIETFQNTFKDNENVFLTIKTSIPKNYPLEKEQLNQIVKSSRNVKIIEKIYKKEELNYLISLCNCYVSLHRSEGFGLTMAEAMYYKKPVIATGYSGNLEFMDFQNSFLVNYEETAAGKDTLNYSKNTIWAAPDLNHASELMNYVYNNQDRANEIAVKGQKTILNNFNMDVVGSTIFNRLVFIYGPRKNESEICNKSLLINNRDLKETIRVVNKSKLMLFILKIKLYFRNR